MAVTEPLATYLELRQSAEDGSAGAGLSHSQKGLFLLHVLELAAAGEPRGGVTLVHDAGDHGGRYLDVARELAQARWAVALPDLRGHGKSEGTRGHSAGIAEVQRDLDAVQDHLAYRLPVAPKALVGVGLGAIYAARYVLDKPGSVAALVLVSPRWRPKFEAPAQPGGLLKMFKKLAPDAPGRVGNDPAKLFIDAAARAAWSKDELVHDAITLRAIEQVTAVAQDVEARLARVDVPTLVLHGEGDPLSERALSAAAGGAAVTLHDVRGARHELLHDVGAPETVAFVRDWLTARVG
ncbi:MAG: alpha/beta fold hydrolase [Planctomycetaceae bacterium]|nr:alpha/beta fold hydrolase [Planctomycetaceae bacterium]